MLTSMRSTLAAGLAAALLALLALACGPSGKQAKVPGDALAGLPPRTDPPYDLSDDDDLGRARAMYAAMPPFGFRGRWLGSRQPSWPRKVIM